MGARKRGADDTGKPHPRPAARRSARRCLTAEAITGPAGLLTVLELDPDSLEAAGPRPGWREQPVTAARTPIPVAVLQG